MPDHDALYHRLFSPPAMVAQLLREFVAEPSVGRSGAGPDGAGQREFHAEDNTRRESDVIWRIPLKGGGDAYLLLLLDFQSTQDRWMALRVLVYIGLLWQQIVKEGRLTADGRLPPVFPLVVYNGDANWVMPVTLRSLIGLPAESPLWRWQPDIRNDVVDEGGFAEADLASRDTLAALLFRLENARIPDQVVALVDAVIDWFRRNSGFETLMPLFAALAGRVVEMAEGAVSGVRVSENLLEVRTMLATRAAEWQQQWRQEGRLEGEAAFLLRLLERRFGVLTASVRDRVAAADLATVEEWGLRVLDAPSIEDVLA